jgi:putative ABC transport system permease protein
MSKYPGQNLVNDLPMYKEGETMISAVDIRLVYVDDDFFKTLKIDLLSGRELTLADTSQDNSSLRVVINESASKRLGIPVDDAPGKTLLSEFEDESFRATIVGVMRDVFYQNLASEVGPFMVIADAPANLSYLVADIHTENYYDFVSRMEDTWKSIMPDFPFEFSFLDDNINALYQTERSLSRIISTFTFLAILISCLGLFGLSVFAAEQRMKEIGIRKVLGASNMRIVGMLSGDFLKLVLLALLIASPLAYYMMNQWLADFAYRIPISWTYFIIAGGAALMITFFTVSFQSMKAALTNPSESLKSE